MDTARHIEKAAEAVRKKNFDYAISLYRQVLLYDSRSGKARRGLREAEFRKFEKRRAPALVRALTTLPHRTLALLHGLLRQPARVAWDMEGVLARDPHDVGAHLRLGRAALVLGERETAKVAFEGALEADPRNPVAAKSLGRLLAEDGDLEGAVRWYEEALKVNPSDQEAIKARKNLAAEGALKAGYEGARSSRELLKDQEKARDLLREERLVLDEEETEAAIRELEEKAARDPSDRKARERLGELHEGRRDLDAALRVFSGLLEEDPENFDLKARVGDLRLAMRQAEVAAVEKEEGAGAALEAARRRLGELTVSEFRWRAREHPTDLALRFQLGEALFRIGEIDEAVGEFQQAVKDPRRRIDALAMLGGCFLRKGMTELAVGQFRKALESLGETSPRALEVRYTLGRIYEDAGEGAKAREEYLRIFERDIRYKDVKSRLERLEAKR